jgi:hypothetical protein
MIGDRIAIAAGDNFGVVGWTDLRNWPIDSDIYASRIVDIPTAVNAVSEFTAEPLADGVHLRWRVNDGHGVSAIEVLRADESTAEGVLGTTPVTGAEGLAEYVDATAQAGHSYTYRLRVTLGGSASYLGPLAVHTPARIDALVWRATGPNPFAQRASVTLAVPRAENGVVRVYDVQGKVVRTLREGQFEAGEHPLEWDGRDVSGAEAPPGLYFVSAQVGDEHARAKLTRIR